jgi:hypothetical protein
VRSYIIGETGPDGERLRSLTYVYGSPLDAEELADFYGLEGPGVTARSGWPLGGGTLIRSSSVRYREAPARGEHINLASGAVGSCEPALK